MLSVRAARQSSEQESALENSIGRSPEPQNKKERVKLLGGERPYQYHQSEIPMETTSTQGDGKFPGWESIPLIKVLKSEKVPGRIGEIKVKGRKSHKLGGSSGVGFLRGSISSLGDGDGEKEDSLSGSTRRGFMSSGARSKGPEQIGLGEPYFSSGL